MILQNLVGGGYNRLELNSFARSEAHLPVIIIGGLQQLHLYTEVDVLRCGEIINMWH